MTLTHEVTSQYTILDAKGAAAYLLLGEKTITRWARKGYIPAHPMGEGKRKEWRFFREELDVWLSGSSNRKGGPDDDQ